MPITDHKNYPFSMIDIKKIEPSPYQHRKYFKDLFSLMRDHSKPSSRIAFLNADFRDFQGIPARGKKPWALSEEP